MPSFSSIVAMLAATAAASPVTLHKKDECTGQHIFHSPEEGAAAANKQKWVDMGFTTIDLAILMKENAGRPTVQEDEDGAPGHWAFTIFNMNWWMVKQSCPEFVPTGYSTSSTEDQIPPEIFQILQYDQAKAAKCAHMSMNDPFFNKEGDAPTSQDQPSPAWWAAQRGGPSAAIDYLAGKPLEPVVVDYMWNTLGIRDWIVKGGHETDDWIESSCLSGLTAPAPGPEQFPSCGAGYL